MQIYLDYILLSNCSMVQMLWGQFKVGLQICLLYIAVFHQPVIDGGYLANWNLSKYYRYHLVMPSAPRRSPLTQDMVGGDNNRTPVIFQVPDIYRFVGVSTGFMIEILRVVCKSDHSSYH